MPSLTRRRPQPAVGSRNETRVGQTPSLFAISAVEWQALLHSRPNLLLVGTRSAVDATLHALTPHLQAPLCVWSGDPEVPLPLEDHGTLVLHELAALPSVQQTRLFHWLDRIRRRVQVVSMTAQPLFSLVERGEFRVDLYYRLNIMRFEVPPAANSERTSARS